jgi:hypothetical protein
VILYQQSSQNEEAAMTPCGRNFDYFIIGGDVFALPILIPGAIQWQETFCFNTFIASESSLFSHRNDTESNMDPDRCINMCKT